MFWCVSYYLGAFVWPYNTQCKTGQLVQLFVQQSHVGIFRNERGDPPHWILNFCFRAICTSLVNLGLFGCLIKLGAERVEVVQKFMPRSRFRIFRNERTRSTPLDTKLLFSYNLYYFGAFGTIWLPYKTRCRTGRSGAKVHATKSHRNFSRLKHPIRPIGP